jgi:hypothetical protein
LFSAVASSARPKSTSSLSATAGTVLSRGE